MCFNLSSHFVTDLEDVVSAAAKNLKIVFKENSR